METTDGELEKPPELLDENQVNPSKNEVPECRKEVITILSKDEEYYYMNNENRGKAIIFNNFNFKNKEYNREDNKEYLNKFKDLLKKLNFQIVEYPNKSTTEIETIIKEASKDDYKDDDCILVAVFSCMSTTDKEIHSYDSKYPSSKICEPFTSSKCTLVGKPKIFIFQTIPVKPKTSPDGVPPDLTKITIPVMADLLIIRSKHIEEQFVDSFCRVFSDEEKQSEHILLLLTHLINDLSGKNDELINYQSTLIRLLRFNEN